MIGRVESDARSKKDIVTNLNNAAVQHNTVKICIKIVPDPDIVAELTTKSRLKMGIFSDGFKHFF